MIQPLQLNSNVTFKSAESPALAAFKEAAKAKMAQQNVAATQDAVVASENNAVAQQPKEKFSISKTYNETKKGVVNTLKGFNTVTGVGAGITRGIVDGVAATALSGLIINSCHQAKGAEGLKILWEIPKKMGEGVFGAIKKAGRFAKRLFTANEPVIKQLGQLRKLPKMFFGKEGYLKGNKAIGAAAIGIGLATLAFRIIQGKVRANENNAGLDHKTNLGHV